MGDYTQPHNARYLDERRMETSDVDRAVRRNEMHAAEGHDGSTPRGNPPLERGKTGQRRREFEQVLGH